MLTMEIELLELVDAGAVITKPCNKWHALARLIRKQAQIGFIDIDTATEKLTSIYLICPARIIEIELRLLDKGYVVIRKYKFHNKYLKSNILLTKNLHHCGERKF